LLRTADFRFLINGHMRAAAGERRYVKGRAWRG
jgi:hypothetical protein